MAFFAQINEEKVHNIVEFDTLPEFAANIVMVEVTDHPRVMQMLEDDDGTWGYVGGEFFEPAAKTRTEIQDEVVHIVKNIAAGNIENLNWKVERAIERDTINGTNELADVYAEREAQRQLSNSRETAIVAAIDAGATVDEVYALTDDFLIEDSASKPGFVISAEGRAEAREARPQDRNNIAAESSALKDQV